VLYTLATRGLERDLLPLCEREGIAVVGYTPFGSWPTAGSEGLRTLQAIGARHGKTPRQVVLRFLTRGPALFAIPKASDPAHVRENAAAADSDLSPDDVAEIERAFPAPRRRTPLATG
jgi:diketogulonate reductase-like aldo/keto reductase